MPTCRPATFQACRRLSCRPTALVANRTGRPLHARWRQHPVLDSGRVLRRHYAVVADRKYGQPTYETHPHILAEGELTPGITALEYAHRRERLAGALPPGGVAIVAAADVKYRSGAVFYQFQQEASFYYLTGFDEPEAVAVITRPANPSEYDFHLFVRPKDADKESWEGSRSGLLAARDVFNADHSHDIHDLRRKLPKILDGASQIFTDIPTKPSNTLSAGMLSRWFAPNADPASETASLLSNRSAEPLNRLLNPIRAIKSSSEIAVMRKTGQMSGRAITAAMKRRWGQEKELNAFLSYEFSRKGCDMDAYIPVVAGGRNALGIHYTFNNDVLCEDEMVLVDAGGQYGHYCIDITRTWPLWKRFSPAQKDLYNAVLNVQRACVSLCRQNAAVSLDTLHQTAESGLKANLTDLGFDLSAYRALSKLFPHHVGHYIGLDLHDTPGLPRTDRLREGHVVTVEPGVYVPNDERWPKHFRGMGIRIEDSVAVQKDTPLVLTTEAVKEMDDIEALLGTGDGWTELARGSPLYL